MFQRPKRSNHFTCYSTFLNYFNYFVIIVGLKYFFLASDWTLDGRRQMRWHVDLFNKLNFAVTYNFVNTKVGLGSLTDFINTGHCKTLNPERQPIIILQSYSLESKQF